MVCVGFRYVHVRGSESDYVVSGSPNNEEYPLLIPRFFRPCVKIPQFYLLTRGSVGRKFPPDAFDGGGAYWKWAGSQRKGWRAVPIFAEEEGVVGAVYH